MYRHTQPSQHVDSRLSDHTLHTYIELKFIEWQHAHLTRLAVVTQCRVAPDILTYVFLYKARTYQGEWPFWEADSVLP